MGKILIALDTSSGMSKEIAKANNIALLPLSVQIDGSVFLDQVNINNTAIYKYLSEGANLTTSQPNVGMVIESFEQWRDSGYDSIMIFTCSSDLSGCNHTYHMVKEQLGMNNVFIVDTRSIGAPIMDVAIAAKQMADAGYDVDEILLMADFKIRSSFSFLYLENVDQAIKSGRLSPVAAGIAGLLKVKPLVYLKEDGSCIDKYGVARTTGKIIQMVVDKLKDLNVNEKDNKIYIGHADNLVVAEKAAELLKVVFDGIEVEIYELPSCLVVHGGHKCVSVQVTKKIGGQFNE